MELHYSQTSQLRVTCLLMFYYLMELHYSQTLRELQARRFVFYYLMELHYSQTADVWDKRILSFTTL